VRVTSPVKAPSRTFFVLRTQFKALQCGLVLSKGTPDAQCAHIWLNTSCDKLPPASDEDDQSPLGACPLYWIVNVCLCCAVKQLVCNVAMLCSVPAINTHIYWYGTSPKHSDIKQAHELRRYNQTVTRCNNCPKTHPKSVSHIRNNNIKTYVAHNETHNCKFYSLIQSFSLFFVTSLL
jgi:hypothetical protein